MARYQDVTSIPLQVVFTSLGFTDFKKRGGKRYGRCPFHTAKKNKTSFSFDERQLNCFSCFPMNVCLKARQSCPAARKNCSRRRPFRKRVVRR